MKFCKCVFPFLKETKYFNSKHSACGEGADLGLLTYRCSLVEVSFTIAGAIKYALTGRATKDMIKKEVEL